jgi:hypothetical protein
VKADLLQLRHRGGGAGDKAGRAPAVRSMTRPIALAANPKPRVCIAMRLELMIVMEHSLTLASAPACVAVAIAHFISSEMVHLIHTV